jgi:hypothetical protein
VSFAFVLRSTDLHAIIRAGVSPSIADERRRKRQVRFARPDRSAAELVIRPIGAGLPTTIPRLARA